MFFNRFAEKYRSIFFSGLLVAYLTVLFGIATPHHESLLHRLVQLAAPIMELGLAWMACRTMGNSLLSRRNPWISGLYVAIPLLMVLVYTAQTYSLYISSNFISVLAIQNRAESRIIRNGWMYLSFLLALGWWLLFVAGFLLERRAQSTRDMVAPAMLPKAVSIALWLVFLLGTVTPVLMDKDNGLIEADYRLAPLTALARTTYSLARFNAVIHDAQNHLAGGANPGTEPRFPLEKSSIYSAVLPFERKDASGSAPNVIVIFTEGTSTRLLGCYGGTYPGLTPNIDRLAKVSMRVTNYYNHTAATYRGLQGQMVSGYPSAGGGEDSEPWGTEQDRAKLSAIRYRSISMILHDNQYKTYFISPHYDSVGLNTLLRSLDFDKVYSFEDISRDVAPGNKLYFVEGALSDDDIFHALHVLMAKNALGASGHPFFMGMYNFGTHAFLDIMPNGEKYADGSNAALNKLHNYDHALGQFLDYFFASPYAKNTILIVTADHASYPERPFRLAAGDDYRPLFVDRIPLIIYDPVHKLPAQFDAQGRTSIDFAPTLMHLLSIQHGDNSFLGTSLFEPGKSAIGFAAIGNEFFATDSAGAYPENSLPLKYAKEFSEGRSEVQNYYQLERENRVFPSLDRVDAGVPVASP